MSAKDLALNLLIKAKDTASGVVRTFKKEVEDSGRAAEGLDRSLDKAEEGIEQLEAATDDAGKITGHFVNQLTDADKAAGRYFDSAGRMHEANGRFAKGARRARTEADRLGDELGEAGRKADGLSGKVSVLIGRLKGLVAATAIGAGLKRFFEQSIGSAARFERQMNRVKAVTGATAEEMKLLERAAADAGSSTEYTAVQAAEGLEILTRAGFNAVQSIELLPSVLAVAAAEGVDLATAAGLVSDTLAVMQMEISKGANVTDILARGSSLANTRMTELGLAISYAGQYAKPAKLDLEKLVAVLNVLANNSLRGERGGTGLRSILAQLSDPASKASQAIKRLNLPTNDFIGLIEGLKQKGPEATEAINAFGIEAGPALRALIAAGAEGITELEQKLRDVDGAAKQMADTATDDLTGGIKEAQSAWEGLITTYGKPLLKPLAALAGELAAKFREMNEDGNLKAWGEISSAALNKVAGGLRIIYNTATFATKAIGVFAGQIISWVADAELQVAKLMNRIGLVSDETVAGLEVQSGAVKAALNALATEAAQDLKDIGAGWDLLSGKVKLGMDEAGDAAEASGEKAKAAGEAAAEGAKTAEQAAKGQAQAHQEAAEAAAQAAREQSEAWKTLGHDVDEVTGSLTESGSAAVTAFETIATSGQASADQIMLAFSSALANAKTEQDVKALEEALIKMGNSGHLMAMYVAEGLEVSKLRAEQLANTVTTALDRSLQLLGVDITKIKTGFSEMGREALDAFDAVQTELKRTGVTGKEAAEITGAAFDKTLARISTAKGLDELKAKLKKAAEDGTISWEEYRKKLKEIEEKYDDLKKASKESIDAQENDLKRLANQARATARSFKDKASFTESDTAANEKNADSTEKQTKQVTRYTHALYMAGKTRKEFAEMGSQMAAEFDRIEQHIRDIGKGTKIFSTAHYISEMQKLEATKDRMARDSLAQWRREEEAIRRVEAALESGQRMSESVLDGIELIDSQRLEGVRSAIRSMNEEARQVEESLKGTVASLQQQLADLRGDRERSEQLAHEQQMLKLREQYEEAKEKGGAEAVAAAREAMNLQQQIHQERVKQIREQKQADEARKREQQTAESINPAAPGTPATSAPPPRPSKPDRVVRVELDLGVGRPVAGEFEPSAAEALLQQLNTVRRVS